jgi:hypothetical protein
MGVGDWAQIASGAGALAAVIVPLFGSQIRRKLVPPRLDLMIDNFAGVRAGPARGTICGSRIRTAGRPSPRCACSC